MIVWQSFAEFIAMGGRGAFVWGSYGVTLLLIALELGLLARSRRHALRELWRRRQIHASDSITQDSPQDARPHSSS